MSRVDALSPRVLAAGFLGVALLGTALLWKDRGTLEHGNRLYRGGDTLAAVDVYRARVAGRVDDLEARGEAAHDGGILEYNLGTSLVTLDPSDAVRHLTDAIAMGAVGTGAPAESAALLRQAHYNLGYGLMASLGEELPTDSAIVLLEAAVRSHRIALRLDVTDEDARWNLALSQRLLDSLTTTGRLSEQEEVAGEDETRIELSAMTRSPQGEGVSGLEPENSRAAPNIGQRRGGSEGAREAWTSQDPGPVSDVDAVRLVENVVDGPEMLIRGILWSHRPDVAWWASQPYPGGGW